MADMKYTLRIYHSDYNVSLIEVEAENSTKALIEGLKYTERNKRTKAPAIKIELEVLD